MTKQIKSRSIGALRASALWARKVVVVALLIAAAGSANAQLTHMAPHPYVPAPSSSPYQGFTPAPHPAPNPGFTPAPRPAPSPGVTPAPRSAPNSIDAHSEQTINSSDHSKNPSPSNREKHEAGQARKKEDYGGEKGDERRRPPNRPPSGWKGPWPPKNDQVKQVVPEHRDQLQQKAGQAKQQVQDQRDRLQQKTSQTKQQTQDQRDQAQEKANQAKQKAQDQRDQPQQQPPPLQPPRY